MVHRGLIPAIFEIALLFLGRRRRFRIEGTSMAPTLSPGDQVLIDAGAYRARSPRRGDVVLCRHPNRPLSIVKRVGRVEGCRAELLGDNQEESTDSRSFGSVRLPDILGRVSYRF